MIAFNGVREIRLKTSEFKRQLIPHLVKFNSGQSILVTLNGRPPYCLKCHVLGHTRQRCPKVKSFANVVRPDQQAYQELQSSDQLDGCFGLNGPLRQYFSLYRAVS